MFSLVELGIVRYRVIEIFYTKFTSQWSYDVVWSPHRILSAHFYLCVIPFTKPLICSPLAGGLNALNALKSMEMVQAIQIRQT